MNAAASSTSTRFAAPRVAAFLVMAASFLGPLVALAPPAAWSQVPPESAFLLTMPASVNVGDTNLQGNLSIQNPFLSSQRVTTLRFAPACASAGGSAENPCTSPEPSVISLHPQAVGSGGACAGRTFTVSGPDASGTYTITPEPPDMPVILAPGEPVSPGGPDTCIVTFTFDVLRAPANDVDSIALEAQTLSRAGVVLMTEARYRPSRASARRPPPSR